MEVLSFFDSNTFLTTRWIAAMCNTVWLRCGANAFWIDDTSDGK
jgi:hypothetical protein